MRGVQFLSMPFGNPSLCSLGVSEEQWVNSKTVMGLEYPKQDLKYIRLLNGDLMFCLSEEGEVCLVSFEDLRRNWEGVYPKENTLLICIDGISKSLFTISVDEIKKYFKYWEDDPETCVGI